MAIWEFQDLVLRPRRPWLAGVVGVVVPPLALAGERLALGAVVPTAAFGLAWGQVWALEPEPVLRLAASAASLAGGWAATLPGDGRLGPAPFAALGVTALAAAWLAQARGASRAAPAALAAAWAVVIGAGLFPVRAKAAPWPLESAVEAVLVASYVVYQERRHRYWTEQRRRAEHDALTGLFTRYGWESWRRGHPAAVGLVVAVDLDDFKRVNDSFGHDAGDAVLTEFARRLREAAGEEAAWVRTGGDEFVVGIPDVVDEARARARVARLHAALTEAPYPSPAGALAVGVSLGWAIGPVAEETAAEADACLLLAKRRGKNRIHPEARAHETAAEDAGVATCALAAAARSLFAAWPKAAALADLQGRILVANPAFAALFGVAPEALVGKKPGWFSAGETPWEVYDDLWRTVGAGAPWHGTLKNRRPGGEVWWAEETITPVLAEGRVVGFWTEVREARQALARGGEGTETRTTFEVVFQPIVRLVDESVLGWEALVRPFVGGRAVSAAAYFASVAGTEREVPADLEALEAIGRAADRLPGAGLLFVNVRMATLVEAEEAFRAAYGALAGRLGAGRLVVEVNERTTRSLAQWGRLADTFPDVAFAQDDVGGGDGDLARLLAWRPLWVKLDRSLTARLGDDSRAADLLRSLAGWMRRTGLRLVAEGVETAEAARRLRAFGAEAGQGFLWGRPSADAPAAVPRTLAPAALGRREAGVRRGRLRRTIP